MSASRTSAGGGSRGYCSASDVVGCRHHGHGGCVSGHVQVGGSVVSGGCWPYVELVVHGGTRWRSPGGKPRLGDSRREGYGSWQGVI